MKIQLKTALGVLLAASLLVAVGCKSELDNKPVAKTEEAKGGDKKAGPASAPAGKADAKKADAKGPASAPAGDKKAAKTALKVDVSKSSIGWVGAKVTGDHGGTFASFKAEVHMEGDKVTGLSYTVDTKSMATPDGEKLLGHLKSPDFLDVEKFPTSTFTATSLTPVTETGFTHKITGDMELRGVKKSVTFPAKVTVDAKGVTGEAAFKISRKDFGIVYPGKPDDLIKDEVLLKIKLMAPRG